MVLFTSGKISLYLVAICKWKQGNCVEEYIINAESGSFWMLWEFKETTNLSLEFFKWQQMSKNFTSSNHNCLLTPVYTSPTGICKACSSVGQRNLKSFLFHLEHKLLKRSEEALIYIITIVTTVGIFTFRFVDVLPTINLKPKYFQ